MRVITISRRHRIFWRKFAGKLLTSLVVFTCLAVMLLPLIWSFLTSIRPLIEIATTELIFWPHHITWANYMATFRIHNIMSYVKNSLIISIEVVVTNLILGVPAAYALSRFSFRGERLLFSSLIVLRTLPIVSIMVPLFLVFSGLNLMNTYMGLILAHTAFKLPVTIWLLRAFIMDIPSELDDAARVDGCSTLEVIAHMTLPLIKPGLAATAILAFLFTWNDLLITLVLSSNVSTEMIALGLTKFVLEYGVAWGPLSAAGMLMFIPTLLFVILAERYLVRGLIVGALKE